MSDAELPPTDDQELDLDDDTLPPEHPAASDPAVSAGEALSGEGIGTGTTGTQPRPPEQPTRGSTPDLDS